MGFKDRMNDAAEKAKKAANDAAEKAKQAAGAFKRKVTFTPSTSAASSSRASREMTGSTGIESTSSSPSTPGIVPPKTKNRSNSTSSNAQEFAHIEEIIAGYNKTNEESNPEKLYYCSEKTIRALAAIPLAEKTPEHPELTAEQLLKNEIYDHLLRGALVLNKSLRQKKTEEIIIELAEKSKHIQAYRNDPLRDGNQLLIVFFQQVVDAMKADYTHNLLGKLNDLRTLTAQDPIEGTEIKKQAKALQRHYSQCIHQFNEEEFKTKLVDFVGKACLLLNAYYCELLTLKLEKKNRFKEVPVQAALELYFEQRKQLYEIVAMTRATEPDDKEPQRLMLRDKFKTFIKNTCAEDQVHEKTWGVSHGPSKWARINTAHEMYLRHEQLPGDNFTPYSDNIVESLRYISEADEELKTLKRHGLFFGYGQHPKADIYTPLNGLFPIEPLAIRLR